QPAEVTAGGCVKPAGTMVGTGTLNGSGQATSPATTTTNTPVQYCCRPDSDGDIFFNETSHTDASAECFMLVQPTAPVTTQASTNSTNVTAGKAVSVTVMMAGVRRGPTLFPYTTLFRSQPAEVTAGGCVKPAGTMVGTGTLNGSGQATSPA